MEHLIQLLIYAIIFAIVGYGLKWVCDAFAMPPPVLWICGGVLLIVLLMFAAAQSGIHV